MTNANWTGMQDEVRRIDVRAKEILLRVGRLGDAMSEDEKLVLMRERLELLSQKAAVLRRAMKARLQAREAQP